MLGAMVPVLVGNVSFAKSKWKTCSLGVYMNQIDSTVNTNKNLMKIHEVKKKRMPECECETRAKHTICNEYARTPFGGVPKSLVQVE